MAKYPYIVNKNGVWYPAGAEVPEGTKPIENKKTEPKKDDFSQYKTAPEDKEESVSFVNSGYTKTEINRMSTADLKKLAKGNGIDESLSGSEIKKALIDKFGL